MEREAKIAVTLLGHKGRCFDVRVNPSNHSEILTSSEDGYARLWDVQRKASIQALHHNKDAEVLRAAFVAPNRIVTAGSDGNVKLWSKNQPSNSSKPFFEHTESLDHGGNDCQVYVCEPDKDSLAVSKHLLTGVENKLILWGLGTCEKLHEWEYFDQREEGFGGSHRNPDKHNYVFDAKWHPLDPSLAVIALSDCSLSVVDIRVSQVVHPSIDLREEDVELGHPTAVRFYY
jgi:WD40 repeat protein